MQEVAENIKEADSVYFSTVLQSSKYILQNLPLQFGRVTLGDQVPSHWHLMVAVGIVSPVLVRKSSPKGHRYSISVPYLGAKKMNCVYIFIHFIQLISSGVILFFWNLAFAQQSRRCAFT